MLEASYVEETTTSIASSGAGAVTLTALTNIPRFSTVFGTQNTTVRYVIEDTVNHKYEEGIGAVSANVLTRTRPQVTWDGTTWNALNPSALAFAASPTSGDIKIRMAATPAGRGAIMSARQLTVVGSDPWHDYPKTSNYAHSNNGAGGTLTADRECYAVYHLPVGGVLSGAQFEVTTAVAASNLKWAIYAQGSDGLPGAKIRDFVTTATTTTGVKTDTATASWAPAGKVYLPPGWYYIGYIASHAIDIKRQQTPVYMSANPLGYKDTYGFAGSIWVAGSYSTGLPAIPSLGSGSLDGLADFGIPWLGLKVVS